MNEDQKNRIRAIIARLQAMVDDGEISEAEAKAILEEES